MNVTGRMLREREDEVFMHERYSQDTEDTNYWSRDFAYLCRGIKLVKDTKFHINTALQGLRVDNRCLFSRTGSGPR